MDIFFQDPTEVPLPPDEVRIRELSAKPYADGKRVRVHVEMDPFQKRPSLELEVLDANGVQVAQAQVIETMSRKLEMTLHLRESQPGGSYTVQALLYYEESPQVEGETANEYPEPRLIDQQQASFVIDLADGSIPVTGKV